MSLYLLILSVMNYFLSLLIPLAMVSLTCLGKPDKSLGLTYGDILRALALLIYESIK